MNIPKDREEGLASKRIDAGARQSDDEDGTHVADRLSRVKRDESRDRREQKEDREVKERDDQGQRLIRSDHEEREHDVERLSQKRNESRGRRDHRDDRQDEQRERGEKKTENDDNAQRVPKDHEKEPGEPKKPVPKWPFVLGAVVVLLFVGVVLWVIFRPRPDVWTDDAYVEVHYAAIAPRVSGQVVSVPVDDDQTVKTGDVLVLLDPSDYQTAVATAQAQVERDTAQTGDVTANVERQPALIDQQSAEVEAAKARLSFSQADARRYDNLASTGAGTGQQRQQADTTLQQNLASLRSAEAQLDAARKQLEVVKKQQLASEATVKADQAQLEQARLNLSYTRVAAPIDGMIGQRSVQVGNTVASGATLMTVVPLQSVYVEANYREIDLLHVRAGQRATIHVDAYEIDLEGVVNGVPAASGAAFAPIAPNNATGNFTKIVQRLPVRIDISPNQPLAKLLRVGLSVEVTVHTGLQDVVAEQRNDPRAVTGR